jgi:hypothetical protein
MWRNGFTALVFLAVICPLVVAAESHRVLVLDVGTPRGADNHRLMLLEVESGKVLADVELGLSTNLAVSDDGRTVAALTYVGAGAKREPRLNFYRAADLSPLQTGLLPKAVPPPGRSKLGMGANIYFSPDGKEIVFCGLATQGNVDAATTAITRVKRELDADGFYRSVTAAKIEPCRGVYFVSLAKWPQAIVLNQTFTELLTVDLESGDILHRLPVAEPGPDTYMPMRGRGIAISGGGRHAYFLPRKPGQLKKIDLLSDPPVMIATGGDFNLRWNRHAVSERAERVFAVEDRWNPTGLYEPSRWVKVFSTSDLSFQREIELPLADCHWLAPSRDGKYLYATGPTHGPPFADLSIDHARLAVIDAASGREVNVLSVGRHPTWVMPAAEE